MITFRQDAGKPASGKSRENENAVYDSADERSRPPGLRDQGLFELKQPLTGPRSEGTRPRFVDNSRAPGYTLAL